MAYYSSDDGSNSYYDGHTSSDGDDFDFEDCTPCPVLGSSSSSSAQPRIQCECKKCYKSRHRSEGPGVGPGNEVVIAAYQERNYDYWFGAARRNRRTDPDQIRELIRRNRHFVLAYRGFCVSFPEPVDVLSSRDYRNPSCEDEVAETAEKMKQLVAQGLWGESQEKHYKNLIDDFRYNEEHCNTADDSAFPRHRALVAASFGSSIAILEQNLWGIPLARTRISIGIPCVCVDPGAFMAKSKSVAIAHAPASSVFTELTARQKVKLVAYSGIAGTLAARLFGSCRKVAGTTQIRHHAFKMVQRAHSTQACEVLMDNRYRYNGSFPRTTIVSVGSAGSVGVGAGADPSIKDARAELRELYPRCIDELRHKAVQYRRGFVDIGEIHANPNFERMYSLMIFCVKYLMNLRNKSNDLNLPEDSSFKRSVRIMKFIAEFPGLYEFDIASVFGLSSMRLRTASRGTQIRLANQGCYAALLSFAVVEPRMVDDYLAPEVSSKFGGCLGENNADNHVASRNKIFGELLKKYRHHIPRTADVDGDICRK